MSSTAVRYRIPFNKPGLTGNELRYVADAITLGHSAGDGAFTRRCHALLEKLLGAPRVLLTTSCTHALEMAALLLDIQPGDEVIVPSFTFVSTCNAFVMRGARPVFVDVRRDTLNLDEAQLEALAQREPGRCFRFTMPESVVKWNRFWKLGTVIARLS
jgi:dTDP-4-amino-4,6-dideoxygalactose transaminase